MSQVVTCGKTSKHAVGQPAIAKYNGPFSGQRELFPPSNGNGPKENLKRVNIEHKYLFGLNVSPSVNRTK